MNDKQSNKFTSLDRVRKFWERLTKKITLKGKVVGYITDFDNILGAIAIKSGIHLTGTSTYTSNKDEKKKLYVSSLLFMLSGLSIISSEKNDSELTAVCKMNNRKLMNMRMSDFNSMTDTIKTKALKYKTELLEENISEADYTDLENDYQNYRKAASEQAESESAKIAATTSLVDLFKKAEELLENFQNVVNILSKNNPALAGEFEVARTVKNLGIRHNNKPDDEEETDSNEDTNNNGNNNSSTGTDTSRTDKPAS